MLNTRNINNIVTELSKVLIFFNNYRYPHGHMMGVAELPSERRTESVQPARPEETDSSELKEP
jgi:hypothetical protein